MEGHPWIEMYLHFDRRQHHDNFQDINRLVTKRWHDCDHSLGKNNVEKWEGSAMTYAVVTFTQLR